MRQVVIVIAVHALVLGLGWAPAAPSSPQPFVVAAPSSSAAAVMVLAPVPPRPALSPAPPSWPGLALASPAPAPLEAVGDGSPAATTPRPVTRADPAPDRGSMPLPTSAPSAAIVPVGDGSDGEDRADSPTPRPAPDPAAATTAVLVAAAVTDVPAPLLVAAQTDETARAADLPTYPTRLPAPAQMQFDLRRGLLRGTGDLSWQPAGGRYSARFEGRFAGMSLLEWRSDGALDAAGVAPTRFTDRRRSGTQAANFQRDAGKITYSGPAVENPLPAGSQDRLSWMVQLAAIAQARPDAVRRDARVSMWVSGARGDADVWTFVSMGPESLELDAGPVPAIRLLREPRQRHDTRVEVWLDPARQYLPARLKLTSGRDDDALDFVRRP